jgi:hypothetical protein
MDAQTDGRMNGRPPPEGYHGLSFTLQQQQQQLMCLALPCLELSFPFFSLFGRSLTLAYCGYGAQVPWLPSNVTLCVISCSLSNAFRVPNKAAQVPPPLPLYNSRVRLACVVWRGVAIRVRGM